VLAIAVANATAKNFFMRVLLLFGCVLPQSITPACGSAEGINLFRLPRLTPWATHFRPLRGLASESVCGSAEESNLFRLPTAYAVATYFRPLRGLAFGQPAAARKESIW